MGWREDQTSHHIPLSQSLIKRKALTLFDSLEVEGGEEAAEEEFEASRGWFMRLKERSRLHNVKVQCGKAAASYPEDLAKILNEGGYAKQQILIVHETALYWREMPSRTLIVRREVIAWFQSIKGIGGSLVTG